MLNARRPSTLDLLVMQEAAQMASLSSDAAAASEGSSLPSSPQPGAAEAPAAASSPIPEAVEPDEEDLTEIVVYSPKKAATAEEDDEVPAPARRASLQTNGSDYDDEDEEDEEDEEEEDQEWSRLEFPEEELRPTDLFGSLLQASVSRESTEASARRASVDSTSGVSAAGSGAYLSAQDELPPMSTEPKLTSSDETVEALSTPVLDVAAEEAANGEHAASGGPSILVEPSAPPLEATVPAPTAVSDPTALSSPSKSHSMDRSGSGSSTRSAAAASIVSLSPPPKIQPKSAKRQSRAMSTTGAALGVKPPSPVRSQQSPSPSLPSPHDELPAAEGPSAPQTPLDSPLELPDEKESSAAVPRSRTGLLTPVDESPRIASYYLTQSTPELETSLSDRQLGESGTATLTTPPSSLAELSTQPLLSPRPSLHLRSPAVIATRAGSPSPSDFDSPAHSDPGHMDQFVSAAPSPITSPSTSSTRRASESVPMKYTPSEQPPSSPKDFVPPGEKELVDFRPSFAADKDEETQPLSPSVAPLSLTPKKVRPSASNSSLNTTPTASRVRKPHESSSSLDAKARAQAFFDDLKKASAGAITKPSSDVAGVRRDSESSLPVHSTSMAEAVPLVQRSISSISAAPPTQPIFKIVEKRPSISSLSTHSGRRSSEQHTSYGALSPVAEPDYSILTRRRLPRALDYKEVHKLRSSVDRARFLAEKINSLAVEDSGLRLWLSYARNKEGRRGSAVSAGRRGSEAKGAVHRAGAHGQRNDDVSTASSAAFPLRTDSYRATEIGKTHHTFGPYDMTPSVPYPGVLNARPSAKPNPLAKSSIFSSLGRRGSRRASATTMPSGPMYAPTSPLASGIAQYQPVQQQQQQQSYPANARPGGPRMPGQPSHFTSGTLATRRMSATPSLPPAPPTPSQIPLSPSQTPRPSFSSYSSVDNDKVSRMEDMLPNVDRATLVAYLSRAGWDEPAAVSLYMAEERGASGGGGATLQRPSFDRYYA